MKQSVSAWVEQVIIPTYGIGKPEKNPIFLEKRVYQGSSGAVYPHPVVEKILDEKQDKSYTAIFLENDYLKIMILPELGGRVQRAYDKIRKRDFVYYNQVIKPALVGLTGPWISGGIEFNWPQHHRPSTFDPVDADIQHHADGSKTVWVNELEKMTRTKGMAGFTLHPDKAYLEIRVQLSNRTFFPQTFLWWANPAVKVNDHYQSVFPPDVNAVYDHGKRDVSDFPIATGTYYKVDYSPGTDISRYKNIPVPTSFMAVASSYDFIGCYENDTQAGMLHVADHHVSPGKKQWTWGNGDFGKAWDRNLTDEDGPYIELMCGAFTDNQPDFSWLQPGEEKSFTQYFYPYAGVGMVKNASRDGAVNIELNEGTFEVRVYTTAEFPGAVIKVWCGRDLLVDEKADLSPATFFHTTYSSPQNAKEESFRISVISREGKILIEYTAEPKKEMPLPLPADPALPPAEIESAEELFLTGTHLEQYRHATFSPVDYYEEALRRAPGDSRCNQAMGLYLLRRGQFRRAEGFFRKAIETLTRRNPNPNSGDAYYHLGVTLKMLGEPEEAYSMFYKSTWNDAWQHAGFLQLSRLMCKKGQWKEALDFIDQSLHRNMRNPVAHHLRITLLRRMGMTAEAINAAVEALHHDHFNIGARYEMYLLQSSTTGDDTEDQLRKYKSILRRSFMNYAELAWDYAHAGLYDEAVELLSEYDGAASPLLYYYKAYFETQRQRPESAAENLLLAAKQSPDYCFPFRIEDVMVLSWVIRIDPAESKAMYYLGNYWYAYSNPDAAIGCWENAIRIDNRFPTVYRNIALAYHNKRRDPQLALKMLERAFALDTTDSRVLMELDQLYKLMNHDPGKRLQLLMQHQNLVEERDDLYLEKITLYNQFKRYEEALELISNWKFHPWEGGEGKVVGQYLICLIELAKKALMNQQPALALEYLSGADQYPDNLGEGKLPGVQENDLWYLKGLALYRLDRPEEARDAFSKATLGVSEPVQAIFYNDPQPDKIVYQGLAWLMLGQPEKAQAIFERLIHFGAAHYNDEIKIDYFAVSLPDLLVFDQDLSFKNKIHCLYLQGLGQLGQGNFEEANGLFQKILSQQVNHQGALIHKEMIGFLRSESEPVP